MSAERCLRVPAYRDVDRLTSFWRYWLATFWCPNARVKRPDCITKEWARAAKRAGVAATFHALRHTHVSSLIAAGLDVLTISKRIGHANAAITLTVYSHKFLNHDDRVAEIIDTALSVYPG
jgi:integrase